MKLTFTYPVYPTQAQETTLLAWLDHLCELQNSAAMIGLWRMKQKAFLFRSLTSRQLLTAAREKYDDFREVPQDFQNHALRRNDKAFAAFRKRCKEKRCEKRIPSLQKARAFSDMESTKIYQSGRKKTKDTDKQTIRVRENPIIETNYRHNRLKVPKLGEVKIYMHRPLEGDPKEVSLVKKRRLVCSYHF